MHNMLNTKKFLVICILAFPMVCAAQQRAALGPVENFSVEKLTITVLGQTFSITSATQIAINGRRTTASIALRRVAPDQIAYVEGVDQGDRSLATSISFSAERYIPGSTQTYAQGAVAELIPTLGQIRIGTLRVDTSSLSPETAAGIQVGMIVQVSGIQPLPTGVVVGPIQLSVGGSGLQSVGGSGIQSVGGSGIQSVGGSGLQSVGGSGTESVGGSGVLSVGGSGTLSVGGSGVLSVGGSGILSVGGSGTLSVGGSGTLSVGGSGSL